MAGEACCTADSVAVALEVVVLAVVASVAFTVAVSGADVGMFLNQEGLEREESSLWCILLRATGIQ